MVTTCKTCEVFNIIIIIIGLVKFLLSHKFSRSKSKDLNVWFFFERKEKKRKSSCIAFICSHMVQCISQQKLTFCTYIYNVILIIYEYYDFCLAHLKFITIKECGNLNIIYIINEKMNTKCRAKIIIIIYCVCMCELSMRRI